MARKDLLKKLMDAATSPAPRGASENPAAPAPAPARVDAARPRYKTGAIGAVSQSIAELKSRSIVEIDPFAIDQAGVVDRLDHDEEQHNSLMASIREYGQQVPVLVRPHPSDDTRFQIVYGRRRVLALRDLGLPVKAMIRPLDDAELVMAQGQENTARKDLTFIEKVNFARQMRDAEYDRKIICDALNIDKTVISRMLTIADAIPLPLIEAIGPAPNVGRDRWLALVDQIAQAGADADECTAMVNLHGDTKSSDDRFEALIDYLNGATGSPATRKTPRPKPPRTRLKGAHGEPLGHAKRNENSVIVTLKSRDSNSFAEWLVENINEIHRAWRNRGGE